MTLAEFLLARISEDEQVALAAPGWHWDDTGGGAALMVVVGDNADQPVRLREGRLGRRLAAHVARHDPARVIADAAAKRKLIAHFDLGSGYAPSFRYLALPYADHPDYDERWAPP